MALVWALALIVTDSPPRTLVVSPSEWGADTIDAFELRAATRSWACVHVLNGTSNGTLNVIGNASVDRISPRAAFYTNRNFYAKKSQTGKLFHEAVLAQLLLRPVPTLRARVEEVEELLGLTRAPTYVGVHMRSMEGKCANRQRGQISRMHTQFVEVKGVCRPVTSAELCSLADVYLEARLHALGLPIRSTLIVIATDGQDKVRLAALKRNFNVTVPSETLPFSRELHTPPGAVRVSINPVYIDMLLMIRAPVFIGVPASTMALNIAAARSYLLADPYNSFV